MHRMPLSLLGYRKLFAHLPEGVIVTLDDACARRVRRQGARAAATLDAERKRLQRLALHERRLRKEGFACVAGVDEVGRGPLAGPLVAAAVVFDGQPWIPMIDDSKKLLPEEREALFDIIHQRARAVGVGTITVEELNVSNLHVASLLAMRRALDALAISPDFVLVDGAHKVPELPCAQQSLIKGDALSVSIAAASIVAKVIRDRHMLAMHALYPQYGFDQNKGYATVEHREGLRTHGASPIHRTLFAPVAQVLQRDEQLMLFDD